MRYRLFYVSAAAVTLAAGTALFAQDANVARGKYLAEEVARCQECHSPRLESGEFDRARWLKGARLGIPSVASIPGWNPQSPDITSTSLLWQRWGADGLVTFLETTRNPRSGKADPPMPAYTLSHDDAVAITAYLKSLP